MYLFFFIIKKTFAELCKTKKINNKKIVSCKNKGCNFNKLKNRGYIGTFFV